MFVRNNGLLPAAIVFTGLLAGCSGDDPPPNVQTPNTPPGQGTAGDTFGVTSSNRLVSFSRTSPSTGTAVAITGLRAGENLIGIDLRVAGTPAGQLIALGNMGGVYSIDPSSGAATMKSTLRPDQTDTSAPFTSLSGNTRISIDFNNVVDQLRVVTNTGQNLRVKVDTGDTSTDANLSFGGLTSVGVTEVGYTNNFASTCRNTVYYLDTSGDRLMTSVNASAGILTTVGNLGFDAGAQSGFDIATAPDGSQSAFATLTVNNVTSLYSINLMTGAATVVGPIGQLSAGESVVGLATPAPISTPTQAVGELVAVTESNRLVSFNSAFPPKLCTTQPVSGLQGGENLLSIDLRPSDGNIYGLTSSARLYTLSAATGVATFRAALTPNAPVGAPIDPFTGLVGTAFTADVSPGADALRVLSNAGQNLAVNMDTGATITATSLSGVANASVTANSYTNSFNGATSATLYNIDTANDQLLTQGIAANTAPNPNGGVLNVVGSGLGVGDVQPVLGFDINALNNTAFAAMTVGSATSASLYSISLTGPGIGALANNVPPAGTATLVGAIGANERIRGLTYSARRQATVLGITTDKRVVSFSPTTPGTFISNNAITGMPGAEQIVGFDIRPSNGLIYVLTSAGMGQGTVYTLNPSNGQATLASRLQTTPLLIGNAFLTDFSPPADALRVMSDAEQNLGVNVDTGGVGVATPITRADNTAVDIVAGAYTSNFSPQNGTVLYSIDMANRQLVLTSPANGGIANMVAPLFNTGDATSITNIAGFDIAGGQDGLSLAALVPSTTTLTTLYRVSFLNSQTVGALTQVGAIGPAGTAPLIGLTILVQ